MRTTKIYRFLAFMGVLGLMSCSSSNITKDTFYEYSGYKFLPLIWPYSVSATSLVSTELYVFSNMPLGEKLSISGTMDSVNVDFPFILFKGEIAMKPESYLIFNTQNDSVWYFHEYANVVKKCKNLKISAELINANLIFESFRKTNSLPWKD